MSKEKVKEICHVCGKVKKPYIVFLDDNIFSLIRHEQAREGGPICERCDRYNAMTGNLKDATKEEFEIAKKASWFANMVLKWWEKDEELQHDEVGRKQDHREWEGTAMLAQWCRKELGKRK